MCAGWQIDGKTVGKLLPTDAATTNVSDAWTTESVVSVRTNNQAPRVDTSQEELWDLFTTRRSAALITPTRTTSPLQGAWNRDIPVQPSVTRMQRCGGDAINGRPAPGGE
uniref:Uncharacterized protein n=1 Tax=Ciona savignyi TaxID=51511 RepID=H2YYT9_CIOSA